jgi:hypothetical protein
LRTAALSGAVLRRSVLGLSVIHSPQSNHILSLYSQASRRFSRFIVAKLLLGNLREAE